MLHQTSNILVPDSASGETGFTKRGTNYVGGDARWRDVAIDFQVTPRDDDAVGCVFRYQNERYYYRFSFDPSRNYRRLVKFYAGGSVVLWEDTPSLSANRPYAIRIVAEGPRITVRMGLYTAHQELFSIEDPQLQDGKVGFYCWGNDDALFRSISIRPQTGLNSLDLPFRVTDQGTWSGPSDWRLAGGQIVQRSNIAHTGATRDTLDLRGTQLTLGDASWADYTVTATLGSQDDDAIGLMFRYRDPLNFYRYVSNLAMSYTRLEKCTDGVFTVLWQIDEGYNLRNTETVKLRLVADGARLRGYLDDAAQAGRKLFDVRDRDHRNGGLALFSWMNQGAVFGPIEVHEVRPREMHDRLNAGELGVDVIAKDRLDLADMKSGFLTAANPVTNLAAKMAEQIDADPETTLTRDPLEQIVLGPEIPLPLSQYLIDQAPHLMLPGLEGVPDNAVMLLESSPDFIAAFLAGANHEMAREMQWRGLQTDLRATVFRQFWDVRGGSEAPDAAQDIAPITSWSAKGLSAQAGGSGDARAVFLVRSELIRRFPDASYFLVRAEPNGAGGRRPGAETMLTRFRGQLAEDMAFFGFPATPEEVRGNGTIGDLGWYFCIEQPPRDARFGLDEGGEANAFLSGWQDLAWEHLGENANLTPRALNATPPPGATAQWAENGAHMAAILLQRPVRIFIHAERLIAAPAPSSEGEEF
ncbi:MAG: hypothetical protein AAGH68_09480 [Pseudomonadota bacterium]